MSQGTATGLDVFLGPPLDETAYQRLLEWDLSRFRHGPLRYDAVELRRLSDLDEAEPTSEPTAG